MSDRVILGIIVAALAVILVRTAVGFYRRLTRRQMILFRIREDR